MRSEVQDLAAGVIFCILATELLPDLVHRWMPWVTVTGFSIGVGVILALKWASERKAPGTTGRDTRGLMSLYGTGQALIPAGKREALVVLAIFCILFTGWLRYHTTRQDDGHSQ